jgi:RimJ/RimL family protein N-acetyltransferase
MAESDESLLSLEIDGIHKLVPGPLAATRRLASTAIHAVFAWSPGAAVLAVTERVARLTTGVEAARDAPFAPEVVPPAIAVIRAALERASPDTLVKVTGGPSFVFPDQVAELPPAALPVIVSDPAGQAQARQLERPSNWEAGEWDQLVSNDFGNWSMALDGNQPVSICHTPSGTDDSVECGTWTRADHRRRGLAAATARAWWARERLRKRILFYSTDHDNFASRGVARKLGLRPLGWLWTVR